jgi:hypothetical protein
MSSGVKDSQPQLIYADPARESLMPGCALFACIMWPPCSNPNQHACCSPCSCSGR